MANLCPARLSSCLGLLEYQATSKGIFLWRAHFLCHGLFQDINGRRLASNAGGCVNFLTRSSLFLASLLAATAAQAGAGLRVICEGDSQGAEVTVNGVFKGECPIDLKVAPGTAKVSVQKKTSGGYLWFYQEFRLGDGSLKKVEVWPLKIASDDLPRMAGAEKGDANYMALASFLYGFQQSQANRRDDEVGKKRNCEQAVRWGEKAMDAGYSHYSLMFPMARRYKDGCGVDVDTERADQLNRDGVKLARAAADQGDAAAMYWLGSAYYEGMGVPVDRGEAFNWANKGAGLGNKTCEGLLKYWQEREAERGDR